MIALHGGDRPEWATKMTQTTNEYFYDLLSDEEKAKIKDTTDSDQARGLVMQSMRDRNRNLLKVALQLQQHLMAKEAMDEPEEDDEEGRRRRCASCVKNQFCALLEARSDARIAANPYIRNALESPSRIVHVVRLAGHGCLTW